MLTCYIRAAVFAELQILLFCGRFSGVPLHRCFADPADGALIASCWKNGTFLMLGFFVGSFGVHNIRFHFSTAILAHNLFFQHMVFVFLLDISNTIPYLL